MSYTTSIKNEICTYQETKSESIATLSALVRNNGYLENDTLFLTTENPNIKEKLISIFYDLYKIDVKVESKNSANFSKNDLFVISTSSHLDFILKDLGYYNSQNEYLESPPEYIIGANEEISISKRGILISRKY